MADTPLDKLVEDQHNIITSCKKGLETTKLQLWQYKSELDSSQRQLAELAGKLSREEQAYGALCVEISQLCRRLEGIAQTFQTTHAKILHDINDPTPLLVDLGEVLGILFGYTDPSLDHIRELLKDHKSFQGSLSGFAPYTLDETHTITLGSFRSKYPLTNLAADDKTPEELQILIRWIECALDYMEKDRALRASQQALPTHAHNKQLVYFKTKEIEELIKTAEQKLERLATCIEEADGNVQELHSLQKEDRNSPALHDVQEACKKIEDTAKNQLDTLLTKVLNSEGMDMISGWKVSTPNAMAESCSAENNISSELKISLKQIMGSPVDGVVSTNQVTIEQKITKPAGPAPAGSAKASDAESSKPKVTVTTTDAVPTPTTNHTPRAQDPIAPHGSQPPKKKKQGGCFCGLFGRKS